jgi:hypothetical protein
MSPEEIVRRNEEMAGFELVDYAEIALPVWQLSLEAVSIAHQRLPPTREFVLRAIETGLSKEEVAGFLGLDASTVDGALAQLATDRLVQLDADGAHTSAGDGVTITPDGIGALEESGISVPVEDNFPVFFDGIHRMPVNVPADQIALPRDTESGLLVELPATPPTKPIVADLKIVDVERLLERQSGGRHEFGRHLLSLKRISRYRRIFRRGVGLVFKGMNNRNDLRLKIIVGGVRDEDLERRFADQGGLARPGFIKAFSDAYLNANLRKHMGQEIAAAILDGDEFGSRKRAFSLAKLRMGGLERKASMVDRGEIPRSEAPLREEVKKAQIDLRDASLALSEPSVRPAAVYEQREFLRSSLQAAKTQVWLSSLGLSSSIVDRVFLDLLERRLKAGLQVKLTVDKDTSDRDRAHPDFGRPYLALQRLADKQPGLTLEVSNEKRYFFLAADRRMLLVSNRPILSHTGRTRTFEQFSGYFVQEPGLIARYLERQGRPS